MASGGASEAMKKLRVFFIPLFATGHIIPMADLAALIARRPGVEPTMVMTPANAKLIQATVDRSVSSGRPVKLLIYPFPAEEAGLLPGQENLASVPYSQAWKVYGAVELCRETLDRLLRDHRPDVVIADIPFWWTTGIAAELGIPHITFHAVGAFTQCVMNALIRHEENTERKGEDPSELVTVPDFLDPEIKIPRSELPDLLTRAWGRLYEVQMLSYGVVVNTFHSFEPAYCDRYRQTSCQRAWFVGPVALANSHIVDVDKPAAECLEWLDQQREGSVVFICLGSWCSFSDDQMAEMATGLEMSGSPFLWVVRGGDHEEWMPEGWEERVRRRGMVARGWAPQTAILGHRSVGAFLTHCGWNSMLEAATAGVPALTWPLIFEQFINERLVVEVAGWGERVFSGFRSTRVEEKVVVPGEEIARVVSVFMEDGEGTRGQRARERASKCKEMAKAAIEEGGSSHNDLNRMIDDLIEFTDRRKKNGENH